MRLLYTMFIVLGLFGLMSSLAGSAGAAGPVADHPVGAEAVALGAESHGAQKDPLGFTGIKRYDLGIYTLVVFGLLFFILARFAWGPMMEGLEKREATIQKAYDDAQKARDDAQQALADVQTQMAATSGQVAAMIEEARRDSQVLRDKMQVEARAEIATERDRLRREIDLAREQALSEIRTQAVQLSTLITAKVIQRNLSQEDHQRLLDESIAEMQTQLKA